MKPYLWAVVCVAVECFGPQMQTVDTPTLSLLIQRVNEVRHLYSYLPKLQTLWKRTLMKWKS